MLERDHLQREFGLPALVSITDHDDMEAPLSLHVLEECRDVPVSVERTVPYGQTFFHLGLHNIDPSKLTGSVDDFLPALHADTGSLIVFNHPCWDEKGIGYELHLSHAGEFARKYGRYLHAFELNGMRPWRENQRAMQMAAEFGKPVISGGDRHGIEPNTIVDVSEAETFPEFVDRVRSGLTNVVVTDQYRKRFSIRILRNLADILSYEGTPWPERVFFKSDDDRVRSLAEIFPHSMPLPIRLFVGGVQALAQ